MPIKLTSINIEGHRHLHDKVIPFLKSEQPDIVCLQEVFEADLPALESALGMKSFFRSMANVDQVSIHQSHALGPWGVAQFTALPIKKQQAEYYVGSPTRLPLFFEDQNPNSMNRILLWSTLDVAGQEYTVATTHFTWSPRGEFTEEQQRDAQKLLGVLEQLPPLVVCGDLNSPRNRDEQNLFHLLAERYTDNIPAEVETTIDGQLHKAGHLKMIVDALFSSPEYEVKQVRIVDGVSDHKGVVGEISRR